MTNYKERIEAKEKQIEKLEKSLERHERKLAKALKEGESSYEIEWIEYDIRNVKSSLEDCRNTLEKYKSKQKEQERENQIFAEAERVFRPFTQYLEEKWNLQDMEKRKAIRREYESRSKEADWLIKSDRRSLLDCELLFQSHMKDTYGVDWQRWLSVSDEEIREYNRKAVRELVISTAVRIKEKAGTVTDYSSLHCGCSCFEGFIKGDKGTVEIRSVLAGGWNIQRLHVRVLVLPVKEERK